MSRDYRHFLAAFAGLIVLSLALGIGAYFGSLYAPPKHDYQTEGSGPRNGLKDISGVPGIVERAIAHPTPKEPVERENRDLAAQESMSIMAFWMLIAVVAQTALALGALVALILDLRQNRDTAKQQLRGYLSIGDPYIEQRKGSGKTPIEYHLSFPIKNYGQTPVFDVRTAINISREKTIEGAGPNFPSGLYNGYSLGYLAPAQDHVSSERYRPDANATEAIISGRDSLYMFVYVSYIDVFGELQRMRASFHTFGEYFEKNEILMGHAIEFLRISRDEQKDRKFP